MPRTVGIHGAAGAVGSATALALASGGAPDGALRLVLADAAAPQLACLQMDLEMLTAALPGLTVATGGLDALAACDVIIACAAVPHRDGAPRETFLEENAAILAPLTDALAGGDGARCRAVVLVSNPVDALATWLQRRLGRRVQVLGHTLNDTLRLRVAIARARGCAPGEVEAWSVGEHGPHAVPLLSRVAVRGAPAALSADERAQVRAEIGGWYARWQRHGTGRTSALASGWGAAAVVRALLEGDARPWPVSTMLCGELGAEGVCLTVPAVLGPHAPPRVVVPAVDEDEQAAISAAAAAVAAAADAATIATAIGGAPCASC
jgi:L-lactate dehydrogenase